MSDGEGDRGSEVCGEFEDFVEGGGVEALHGAGVDSHFSTSRYGEAESDIGLAFGPGFYPAGLAVVRKADHHVFVGFELFADFRFSATHELHELFDAVGEVGPSGEDQEI